MTEYKAVDIDKWVLKTRKRMNAVVKQAVGDTISGVEVVPGITRGGSRVRGTIPRDIGTLALSLRTTLYGSTAMSSEGEDSHVIGVASMSAGDVIRFSWGGPLAGDYVKAVHYGSDGVPGTFWIDEMVEAFPGHLKRAVARAKARVRG